jgi:hypothetical protein
LDAVIANIPAAAPDRLGEAGEGGVDLPDPAPAAGSGPRLPALGLFRAFDAVVRYRSFRRAAEELCVTPSISRSACSAACRAGSN